jgi:superfamily II DNA or RNA helicase
MAGQTLRDYQLNSLNEVRRRVRSGERSVLLCAPTGAGKTTIAASLIESATGKGNGVLFLAHRKELIDQCSARLDQHSVPHGIIMAKHPRWLPHLPVQVASVQTLIRRAEKWKPDARILIVDEAHHARADSYHRIIDDLYPGATVVGLTATPWRIDGRGLGDLFQSVVVAALPRQLIEQGFLVPYTGYAFDRPDLSGVRKTAGDYNEADLAEVMVKRELLGNVVEQWKMHCHGKRTAVFCCDVKHSIKLRDEFLALGVTAEHLDAKTPKEEREAILRRLASGATAVVCNVGVLTEGWDCPAVEVIVMARPTDSLALYLQMVGRGMRPNPETGKTLCRIHDHAGNIIKHGLPDAERDYSLTSDTRKERKGNGEEAVALRTCAACFAIYAATEEKCPVCQHVNPKRERKLRQVDDAVAVPLEEIAKYQEGKMRAWVPERQARDVYDALLTTARERGYKGTWAAVRFKERFGFYPRSSWRQA